jgi:hypothetical protein
MGIEKLSSKWRKTGSNTNKVVHLEENIFSHLETWWVALITFALKINIVHSSISFLLREQNDTWKLNPRRLFFIFEKP